MATETSSEPHLQTSSLSVGLWAIAILLPFGLAWLGYSYPPKNWVVPDDMSHIGALSSAKDQERLAAVVLSNLWKNSLLKFALAGLAIGVSGVVLFMPRIGKKWPAALGTLIFGLVSGLFAGAIGLLLRRYLDLDHPIPLISPETRPLFCDSLVFTVFSILLLLPISLALLLQPQKLDRQKATTVPLAGLITGLAVPFLGAMLLPASASTGFFPPRGWELVSLWFATMAIATFVVCVFRGGRKNKLENGTELGDA